MKTFAFLVFTPRSKKACASEAVYTAPSRGVNESGKLSIIVIFRQTGPFNFPGICIQKNGIQLFLLDYLLELSIMTSFADTIRHSLLGGLL